ncbi:MAG: PAS domain-containing protein [Leptolyngbya sp. SIO4C1]|nr:PAS domain-containing protein [Leptolyngbya sp. SIO4C1]
MTLSDVSASSAEFLASLLDAIANPIYVKDAQHCWIFANRACCELLGQSREALVRSSAVEQLSPAELLLLKRQDEAFLHAGEVSHEPILLTGANGKTYAFVSVRSLLQDADGCPLLVNTLRDVTELSHIQETNQKLQLQLQKRSDTLETLLDFEATLKRITDRVRDSLDEKQILQTAVQELTEALGVKGSNTALYDLEQGTSTIYYEYTTLLSPSRGRVSQMEAFPEVYHQLLEGQYFQFCSIFPNPVRGHVSMFACPILDDRGVLGDLWLINDKDYGFNELDIRLVQQVANQCAIAIRQARLYQESQSQVRELERVNTLKDDFLSTVSHELRTPVTSMRVALQLLGVTLAQEMDLETELKKPELAQNRMARYYRILKEECEREISLINDLLDLQRLDVGNHPILSQPIHLPDWLPALVNGFQARTKSRDQNLRVIVPEDIPILISDLSSIERILAELLNNACKYTPPEGEITLAVSATDRNSLQFDITNTGVEIPAEEMPRIFDKFYRVPSADPWKQGGTGLGLALVQKLTLHIEGTVSVSSGDGQTCFTIELPLSLAAK